MNYVPTYIIAMHPTGEYMRLYLGSNVEAGNGKAGLFLTYCRYVIVLLNIQVVCREEFKNSYKIFASQYYNQ